MPAFRFLLPENEAQGVATNTLQAGASDSDAGVLLERAVALPWTTNPKASWFDYRCWVEYYLDPGMVVHRPLPQSAASYIDTLASVVADPLAKKPSGNLATYLRQPPLSPKPIDECTDGVNLVSKGSFTDYAQRMANSEYTFVLRGWGIRAGYQVPVPALLTVAGVAVIPGKQWALGNRVEGNYSGVPVFFNSWELWYSVILPPTQSQTPPPNVAQHVRADAQLPSDMQVAFSEPDQNAVPAVVVKPQPQQFIALKK